MILGQQGPKMVLNLGLSNEVTVLLDHANVEDNWSDPQEIEQKAVTGVKYFKPLGDYADFKIDVNLFDYADPMAKFQEIYALNHQDVTFWRHRDRGGFCVGWQTSDIIVSGTLASGTKYIVTSDSFTEGENIYLKGMVFVSDGTGVCSSTHTVCAYNPITFHITMIKPYLKNNLVKYDMVLIELTARNYVRGLAI